MGQNKANTYIGQCILVSRRVQKNSYALEAYCSTYVSYKVLDCYKRLPLYMLILAVYASGMPGTIHKPMPGVISYYKTYCTVCFTADTVRVDCVYSVP